MKRNKQQIDAQRRRFLGGAAAAGAGFTIGTLAPLTAVADAGEPEPGHQESRGYRLTQHVLDYYRSAAS